MPEALSKIAPDAPETASQDGLALNVERLQALFPEAFSEGRLDFEVLKELLGAQLETRPEKYGLNWHGKAAARRHALTPTRATLRPDPTGSVDWDTTQNLMIEGDNLEVLKLLQRSYAGKVKLIYIDPPYNTGQDFVYPDDYTDSIANYQSLTGQSEEGRRVSSNTESSGRFHTDWLNMMYPRLKLARELLKDDGIIFVSIGDKEIDNLTKLLKEIFGEENYITNLVWEKKKKGAFLSNDFSSVKDYISVSKKSQKFKGMIGEINGDTETYPVIKTTNSRGTRIIKSGIKSKYRLKNHRVESGTRISSGNMEMILLSELEIVDGVLKKSVKIDSNWIYSQVSLDEYCDKDELYITQDLYFRRIVSEERTKMIKDILPMVGTSGTTGVEYIHNQSLFFDGWGTNEDGFDQANEIFGIQNIFSFPKPTMLISKLIQSVCQDKNDVILDFFAGSGTTGQAVLDFNVRSGQSLNYILIQLPEVLNPTEQKTAADFCASLDVPLNIAELTKERLRRAGAKVKKENPMFAGDTGFKVFKLDSSNLTEWDAAAAQADLEQTLENSVNNIKAGRSEQDVLFELLLKLGLELITPIETRPIAGKQVHSVGAGALVVCLERGIDGGNFRELGQGIADWTQEQDAAGGSQLVFLDNGFADDIAKTNLSKLLEQRAEALGRTWTVRSI